MNNPYITSELTEELKHMRRRYSVRMWITLGILIITIWLVLQLVNNQPTFRAQILNRDKFLNNQITRSRVLERYQGSQRYLTKADINKINKLNDIADV